MSKIIIKKSAPLSGNITCSGSKNAALPILASTILTQGKNFLYNIPNLTDIEYMLDILKELGGQIEKNKEMVCIDFTNCTGFSTPYEAVSKFRGSFLLAAPLLARMGKARISMPGGCPIGTRPIDLHLKGFAALGAEIEYGHGFVDLKCKKLRGNKIYLDFQAF